MLYVPVANLREDGERRVIYYHAVVGIVEVLEISSRIERTDHWAVANIEMLSCPAKYRLIHRWGYSSRPLSSSA